MIRELNFRIGNPTKPKSSQVDLLHNSSLRVSALNRRGVASLEFIMGLPFILGLGAAIIMTAWGGVTRSKSAILARHQVWKVRDPKQSLPAGFDKKTAAPPLYLFADSNAGQVSGSVKVEFDNYWWLGGKQTATSKAAVLTDTWDHRALTTFHDSPKITHVSALGGVFGMSASQRAILDQLIKIALMDFSSLPNQSDVDAAGNKADEAKKEMEKKKAELEAKIQALKDYIDQLKRELTQLKRDEQAILARKTAAENELARLKAMKPQDPAAIQAQENVLNGIEGELTDVRARIKAKEELIRQKEEELRITEEEKRKGEIETGKLPGQ